MRGLIINFREGINNMRRLFMGTSLHQTDLSVNLPYHISPRLRWSKGKESIRSKSQSVNKKTKLGLIAVKSKAAGRKPDDPILPSRCMADGINSGDKQRHTQRLTSFCPIAGCLPMGDFYG